MESYTILTLVTRIAINQDAIKSCKIIRFYISRLDCFCNGNQSVSRAIIKQFMESI